MEDCLYLEKCPIFRYFKHYAQVVYMEMYCQGNFQQCQRYQLRQKGEPVPDNPLPHDGTLWDDQVRPPKFD